MLSIVPPDRALAAAEEIAAAAAPHRRRAARRRLECRVARDRPLDRGGAPSTAGLEFVDGSISGGPPRAGSTTRVYLSGARAEEIAAAAPPEIDARVIGGEIGLASAVKMCTAAMYKGSTALLAHSLLTAQATACCRRCSTTCTARSPARSTSAPRSLAVSATKAERFVGEMREIAATQASAGLTPALFEALAEVYAALAESALGHEAPERSARPALDDVLARLRPRDADAGERT